MLEASCSLDERAAARPYSSAHGLSPEAATRPYKSTSKRRLIENSTSDGIDFSHMDDLSSAVAPKLVRMIASAPSLAPFAPAGIKASENPRASLPESLRFPQTPKPDPFWVPSRGIDSEGLICTERDVASIANVPDLAACSAT